MQRNILIKFENIMNSRQQFGDPIKIDDLNRLIIGINQPPGA